MTTWHEPPIAKVYEALGAVADGRVTIVAPTKAEVVSSSGDKAYSVEWAEDFSWITSNDNASYWQGYLGYPIIAVLLLQGKITYAKAVSEALKGVPWKKINTRHKNKYDKTIQEVLEQANAQGGNREDIVRECERIHSELKSLKLERSTQPRKAPPSGKPPTAGPAHQSQGKLL